MFDPLLLVLLEYLRNDKNLEIIGVIKCTGANINTLLNKSQSPTVEVLGGSIHERLFLILVMPWSYL